MKWTSHGVAVCAVALAACTPSEPPLRVSAVDLYAAYLRNAATADQQYGGQSLIVDGMSGGIDSEGSGYILTLVPGVRAHLSAETSGANLFQQVAVQCGDAKFADAALDLTDCKVISSSPANQDAGTGSNLGEDEQADSVPDPVPDKLAAAFAAATGHETAFDVEEEGGTTHVKPIRIVCLAIRGSSIDRTTDSGRLPRMSGIYRYLLPSTNRGSSFRVVKSWPKAIEGDGWGAPPPTWYLTEKFTTYPAIYTEGGYMYHGDSGTSATLTELQPSGPTTSETIDLGASNVGAFEGSHDFSCEYVGKIVNLKKDRSFDVTLTGSIGGTDHYIKRGGKFITASEANRGPTCT